MQLDRKQHPDFKTIEEINIPTPEVLQLDNGISAFLFNIGTQEVLKIELVINAGSWQQPKPLVASVVNEMLIEGTKNYTSREIAEKLDFYGAFIHQNPTKDFANITLYTLNKYLPETIEILKELIRNPIFSDQELSTFLNKRKQQFLIELEKVNNIARREFNAQLFGENHPYGKKVDISDYNQLTRSDLIDFHKKYYQPTNCKLIVSGKITSSAVDLINQYIGDKSWKASDPILDSNFDIPEISKTKSIIEKDDAMQSAIRLGKVTINKDHPDFHKLNVANNILGGFFGSRLMKKIREEKGYTYGINSVLVTMKHHGYFVILSEVGKDVSKDAITDILNEIKELRTNIVSLEELALVRNYMLGEMLRSFDGPFEISSSYRSIIDFELGNDYFNDAIKAIKSITPIEIKDMFNKNLNEETLVQTVAGKYN